MTSPIQTLCELPEYSQVLINLVVRNLKVRYQRSFLGFLWTLVYPALMLGIYIGVFGVVLRINIPDFWAYLVAGLLPFQFLMSAVVEGAGAIRVNGNLLRKIYFPAEILVISTITSKLIEFILQLVVAGLFLVLLHHGEGLRLSVSKAIIVLPGAIFLLYVMAIGIALPLASWSVLYKDLEHLIAIGMTAWFYLTPVFWSVGIARAHLGGASRWLALNPALDLIELFRGPLYAGTWPVNEALGGGAATAWGVATLVAALFFFGGYSLFNRSKRILSEVV